MKPALQAIEFEASPLVRLAIVSSNKKITIREGHRDYHLGKVILCGCVDPWAVSAIITQVRHTTIAQVTKDEYEADGYNSHEQMLDDLRRFYPDINMDSKVTVVYWRDVSGTLAKEEYVAEYAMLIGYHSQCY